MFIRNFFLPTAKNNYEAWIVSKRFLALLTAMLLFINIGLPLLLPSSSQVAASSIKAETLIELANQERKSLGFKTLKTDERLTNAAYEKAYDMFNKDYWSHFGPEGETPWYFIRQAGYDPYKYAGENLAKGFSTAEGVHQAWMASPTHRANLVSEDYSDIGIAVLNGNLKGENVTLVVQMFGTLASNNNGTTTANKPPVVSNYDDEGNILSIKITAPTEGEVFTSPDVQIKGTLEVKGDQNKIDESDIKLIEGSDVLETIKPIDGSWESSTLNSWKEGKHKVEALLQKLPEVATTVQFEIDTIGPDIEDNQLTLTKEGQKLTVKYRPNERDVTAVVLVNQKVYIMENKEGMLTVSVPKEASVSTLKLIATDRNGNSEERVIDADSSFKSNASILGVFSDGSTIKSAVNIGFAIGMLVVLLLQIYNYNKLRLLEHKAGYLFTVIIWISLIVLTTVIKSSGVVS